MIGVKECMEISAGARSPTIMLSICAAMAAW